MAIFFFNCVIVSVELILGKLIIFEFLICLHRDSLNQGKRGVNEREIRETSECLSFQAFLSVCFSHGFFPTLDASIFFTFLF